MSVINMFRKEALRHQYKSQDFGHAVIKQPSIISNAILSLCAIMLVGLIAMQFMTLATNQSYSLKLSAENYQPLVMSKAVVIREQLADEGARVNRDQLLVNVSVIGAHEKTSSQHHIRAFDNGYYFHSYADSNIIPAYTPIGYLLKQANAEDFAFWLQEKPKIPVRVGTLVTLMLDDKVIDGRVAMIVGSFVQGQGQKILVKISDNRHLSMLAPNAKLKILLKKQPKTIAQLLG